MQYRGQKTFRKDKSRHGYRGASRDYRGIEYTSRSEAQRNAVVASVLEVYVVPSNKQKH